MNPAFKIKNIHVIILNYKGKGIYMGKYIAKWRITEPSILQNQAPQILSTPIYS